MPDQSEDKVSPAPSLRDRIAAAWSDHETGTLRPEGYVPCRCGQRFTSPQALSRHRADVMLEALADTNPTDLGLEQVGWIVRFPGGIEFIRPRTPFTNDSDMGRQQPVYARPPAHTEDSRQAQWWCWVHGGRSVSLAKGCERQHVDTRFASTPCSWVRSLASKGDDHG